MKSNKSNKPQSAAGDDAISINSEGRICCQKCGHFKNNNCTHLSNRGIVIQYRKEKEVFLKSVEELNKDGDCTNYVGS